MNDSTIIKVHNLAKKFESITAVNNLSLSVFQGDIYGLLGVNGSGKSTTIKILLSLIRADYGNIEVFGRDLKQHSIWIRKNIGTLIERPDFFEYLTAYKNLEILLKYSNLKPNKAKIIEVLSLVGLSEFMNEKVKIFSQGMKQRLGIAQAILHNPKLLILDEPANGLDPHGVVDIRNLILKLNKEMGLTILLSSHLLREVELICNRMIIIHKGQAVAEGFVKTLLNESDLGYKIKTSNISETYRRLSESQYSPLVKLGDEEITCQVNEKLISEINVYLVKQKQMVTSIEPIRSLEEYFLNLT